MEKPKAKICKMSYAWKNGKSFYTFFSTLTLDTFSTSPPLTFSAPLPQPSQSLTHGSSPSISWFFSPSPPLNSLTHKATHNPLISLAPLTQPISLTYLAQFILHRRPPTDRHHPPSSALPSFITVSSLHKHPLLFSLAPSLGSDWQAVVLGFWWLLQSCLCLYVQIRFFIRGFFFFFFFWVSDLGLWRVFLAFWSGFLVVGGWWLFFEWLVGFGGWLCFGGCFFLPDAEFWVVVVCATMLAFGGFWELWKKNSFYNEMKQTLENDFHCIFKYEVKHNKMKMF